MVYRSLETPSSTASPSPRGLTGIHTFSSLSLSQRPHWYPHLQQPLPLPEASLVSTLSTASPSPRGLTGVHTFNSLSLSQRPHWCPHLQQTLPLPEASLVSTPSTASPSPTGLTGVHTFNRLSLSQRPQKLLGTPQHLLKLSLEFSSSQHHVTYLTSLVSVNTQSWYFKNKKQIVVYFGGQAII